MMKRIDEISKKNPFKVPDNYFEDVNNRIILATSGSVSEKKKPGLFVRFRPYITAAASIAVLVALSYITVKLFRSADKTRYVPEISMQEFSDTYLDDIDILTLEENADPMLFSEELSDVEKPVIIDYLILDNIDLNDIYELL